MSNFTESFITIDQGNTNTSICLHNGEEVRPLTLAEFQEDLSLKNLKGAYSSVSDRTFDFTKNMKNIKESFISNGESSTFLNMPVNYSKTLGSDRLITAFYVFNQILEEKLKYKNVILIDAGTFTTIDFINSDGFQGGYILPGETTYLSSFGQGDHLPIFENAHYLSTDELPHNTEEAIKRSYILIIESVLSKLSKNDSNFFMLTGGSSKLLSEILNLLELDFSQRANLVHESLAYYFQFLQSKENTQ